MNWFLSCLYHNVGFGIGIRNPEPRKRREQSDLRNPHLLVCIIDVEFVRHKSAVEITIHAPLLPRRG